MNLTEERKRRFSEASLNDNTHTHKDLKHCYKKVNFNSSGKKTDMKIRINVLNTNLKKAFITLGKGNFSSEHIKRLSQTNSVSEADPPLTGASPHCSSPTFTEILQNCCWFLRKANPGSVHKEVLFAAH